MKDPLWPVEVHLQGEGSSAALMNGKSYQKSRESGVPWVVHPETRRVLPWPGEPRFLALEPAPGGYLLRLPAGSEPLPYGSGLPQSPDPDIHTLEKEGEILPREEGVLFRLSSVLTQRRRLLPEGSYSTHLFRKGEDKIRKKLGEEAVELLLARKKEELIFESADLIYHLLMLLEVSDLSWKEVIQELSRREDLPEG